MPDPPPENPPTEQSSPTVLIVEDETDVVSLYELWLPDEYSVLIAKDGEEALSLLDESVDVVLLDRRMPGISGDAVLEEVRSKNLDCRVAMVSAVTPDYDVLEMGFDDYLIKPVEKEDVLETIDRMLRRSDYDDNVREFYQLAAKRAALQEAKSEAELRNNDGYRQLEAQIAEKRSAMDEMVTTFEEEDFEAAFRQLGKGG